MTVIMHDSYWISPVQLLNCCKKEPTRKRNQGNNTTGVAAAVVLTSHRKFKYIAYYTSYYTHINNRASFFFSIEFVSFCSASEVFWNNNNNI